MNSVVATKIDKLSKKYPFAGDDIFSFYLLIMQYEEKYKMNKSTDEIFDIIQRVLDIACIYSISPGGIINIIYSQEMHDFLK